MNIDADLLDTFVEFAKHLNFTYAAQVRHLSQPALHMQVRKLSEQLGVKLYQRRGRQLELTSAGQKVVTFARDFRHRSQVFLASLHGYQPKAPIVMCAGEGAYLYLLGPAIQQFRRITDQTLHLMVNDADKRLKPCTMAVPILAYCR